MNRLLVVYGEYFSRISPFAISGILLSIPLLPAAFGMGYDEIKAKVFQNSISILGVLWLVYLIKNHQSINIKPSPLSLLVFLFITLLLLSSLLGLSPSTSIWGTAPYFQGWILYFCLGLFYLIVNYLQPKPVLWVYILLVAAALVSVVAIKDWLLLHIWQISIPTYAGRIVSTFGQPNLYAGFLLMVLPLTLWPITKMSNNLKIIFAFLSLILVISITLSYSRTAVIIMLSLLLYWLLEKFNHSLQKLFITIIITIVCWLIIGSLIFSSGLIWQETILPLTNQWLVDNSPEKRIYIWPLSIEIAFDKPVFGFGLENISLAYNQHLQHPQTYPAYFGLKNINVDRAHNYLLDVMLFAGLIGLGSYMLLIRQVLQTKMPKTILICLAIYLIWIQFQIQSVVHLLFFWLLVGLIDKPVITIKKLLA